MKKQKQSPALEEISKLIIDCINNEQFFEKKVLIPKVRAILAGFNVNLNLANYSKEESPSDAAKRLRALEQKNHEIKFWLSIIKNISTEEQMSRYYLEQEAMLVSKGFKEAGGKYM